MAKPQYTFLEPDKDYGFATLKGKALVAAQSVGLIPAASAGDGYNIAPFLRFWDAFSPALQEVFEDFKQSGQMFNQ